MVLFFALFGFLFLCTQYLQFVLGYSPSEAGVRVLPYAGAMIVFAAVSAKLVERFGTKRVATAGMVLFAPGLAVAATVGETGGYGRLAVAFVLMGTGMGLAGAPATESIMGSLPPERANIGSAVNDTTRELGGALGVADRRQHHVLALRVGAAERPTPELGAAVGGTAWPTRRARRSSTRCHARRSSSRSSPRSARSSPGATCRRAASHSSPSRTAPRSRAAETRCPISSRQALPEPRSFESNNAKGALG